MGYYDTEYWLNDAWGESRSERQSGVYHPFTPDFIACSDFDFSPQTLASISEAETSLALLSRSAAAAKHLSHLLLRSEALSSSRIEGLEAPLVKLLEAEELRRLGVLRNPDKILAAILGSIDMMSQAVSIARRPLSVQGMCEMHRLLVRGTPIEPFGGIIRTTQNWIGGNRTNPIGATYVPPQPEKVLPLLDDLVLFCNESSYPVIAKAAIAHAQFEAIHPFADGNGRTGRALVHALASDKGIVPPVSIVLVADRERYLECLAAFQSAEGSAVEGAVDAWVDYFAQALTSACKRAEALGEELSHIEESWRKRVPFRRGSAGAALLGHLASNPIITVAHASELTGASLESCRLAVNRLVEEGVLKQTAKNRKSGLFVAMDVVDALSAFERAVATRSGSTANERPMGKVPQRRKGAYLAVPPLGIDQ